MDGVLKDSESDTLDLDAIDDRLHGINVLGQEALSVWTSVFGLRRKTYLAALAAARSHTDAIRSRYDSAEGPWRAWQVSPGEDEETACAYSVLGRPSLAGFRS